jgi:hypothetical protein
MTWTRFSARTGAGMVVKLLPDQPTHGVPARQWLVHVALDEGPAVQHTVLHWAGMTQRWRM